MDKIIRARDFSPPPPPLNETRPVRLCLYKYTPYFSRMRSDIYRKVIDFFNYKHYEENSKTRSLAHKGFCGFVNSLDNVIRTGKKFTE